MKKLKTTLIVFLLTTPFWGQSQNNDLPCTREIYTTGDVSASPESPDFTDSTNYSIDSSFTFFNNQNDTILKLKISDIYTSSNYFIGEFNSGSNYNTLFSFSTEVSYSYFSNFSSGGIQEDLTSAKTQNPEKLKSSTIDSRTLFFISENTTTKKITGIWLKNLTITDKGISFTSVNIENFKPRIYKVPPFEYDLTDSLFYDQNGNLVTEKRYSTSPFSNRQLYYTYNSQDQELSYIAIDSDGDTSATRSSFYNQNNKLVRRISTTYSFKEEIDTVIYNIKGKISYTSNTSTTTNEFTKIHFIYENNQLRGWNLENQTGTKNVTVLQDHGNYNYTIKQFNDTWFGKDTVVFKNQYAKESFEELDKLFEKTVSKTYSSDGNTLNSEYLEEYDSYGNLSLVKSLSYSGNNVSIIRSDSVINSYDNENRLTEQLKYTYNNNLNKYFEKQKDQYGCFGLTVGLNKNKVVKKGFHFYPNPAHSTLFIEVNEIETVTILNTLGEVVLEGTDNEINIANLAQGLYIINIKANNRLLIQQFIKQ